MNVSLDKILQILGQECIKVALLEEQVAQLTNEIREMQTAPVEETEP